MSNAVETVGLGRRYGRHWALRECRLSIPEGRVVALVGPNGAGKTTLLNLVAGLIRPSAGSVLRFGEPVRDDPASLGRFAYLAQDSALYPGFRVADLLTFGRKLNPRWDDDLARDRLAQLGIPPRKRVRQLSGGQRAQCALVLASAKRPDLLLLDEPLASLDPLARHDVMALLMETVALHGTTVVLSSHIIADLVDTCDWLVAVNRGRIQVSGEIDELLAGHAVVSGPVDRRAHLPDRLPVVTESVNGRQVDLLTRATTDTFGPAWSVRPPSLDELVRGYLGAPDASALPGPVALAR
ncbi:ABC transporter ATP-binding protein [Asanoa ishikariensis]|uniref:ABC-2 type transport system ATP-binding protein n=1 Tax=Asanoa ishikariensis TaxID=137265 RepID=A0A1H3UJ08_9ACTN|nr:ABC transporter ATP-binding protein [Asanoa ishikariensis]GIF63476.1 ABC transporter ATP-binding protein [Asanoa ishikariensis]SDZ62021.1 ABC-2 type transport system ATP-binding protein [Asanoa ishikariensis]